MCTCRCWPGETGNRLRLPAPDESGWKPGQCAPSSRIDPSQLASRGIYALGNMPPAGTPNRLRLPAPDESGWKPG
jgi:hypothetical protein